MALGGEIINLRGLAVMNQADQVGGVGEIAVMQDEAHLVLMGIGIEMIDARGVERRRAPFYAMDFIALIQQEFGEIGAVLPGHAGNQGNFLCHPLILIKPSLKKALSLFLGISGYFG